MIAPSPILTPGIIIALVPIQHVIPNNNRLRRQIALESHRDIKSIMSMMGSKNDYFGTHHYVIANLYRAYYSTINANTGIVPVFDLAAHPQNRHLSLC